MFKLGFDGSSYSEQNETASLLNQLSGQAGTTMKPLMSGSGTEIMPLVEEKIRVSVYWYKAPVTKTHCKKPISKLRSEYILPFNFLIFRQKEIVGHKNGLCKRI
jgi:hypothetical protein